MPDAGDFLIVPTAEREGARGGRMHDVVVRRKDAEYTKGEGAQRARPHVLARGAKLRGASANQADAPGDARVWARDGDAAFNSQRPARRS